MATLRSSVKSWAWGCSTATPFPTTSVPQLLWKRESISWGQLSGMGALVGQHLALQSHSHFCQAGQASALRQNDKFAQCLLFSLAPFPEGTGMNWRKWVNGPDWHLVGEAVKLWPHGSMAFRWLSQPEASLEASWALAVRWPCACLGDLAGSKKWHPLQSQCRCGASRSHWLLRSEGCNQKRLSKRTTAISCP